MYFREKYYYSMIAIVSYVSIGSYDTNTVDEDKILSSILTELNEEHEIVPWSDENIDWSKYDTLLIKSIWDYFDHYAEFLNWIDRINKLNIKVLNNLETISWNSTKGYLEEIKEKGFPVITGVRLEKGKTLSFETIHASLGSGDWVVKPMVSGGAKNTLKIASSEWSDYESNIQLLVQEEEFLVQPFIKEVEEEGEYSLIFFDREFSHAVLKTPASGDFRVQHYFGGSVKSIEPSSEMSEAAKLIVEKFAPESLYARVDGVLINGIFHLMELELIEPYLFLDSNEFAVPNYKKALIKRLG